MNTRPAQHDDRRYIATTWVRSFARISPWNHRDVTGHHGRLVDALLDRRGVRTVVLYLADPRAIQAWACGEAGTLHYVYVPPELRGHGLARRVMREALGGYPQHIDTSHPWPCSHPEHRRCRDLGCSGRGARFKFNPYPLVEAA